MATFYDWLQQLAADGKITDSFSESFGDMSEAQQERAFQWLKIAYVSGFENAGGKYLEDLDVEIEGEHVKTVNSSYNYVYLLKNKTRRSLPKNKMIASS